MAFHTCQLFSPHLTLSNQNKVGIALFSEFAFLSSHAKLRHLVSAVLTTPTLNASPLHQRLPHHHLLLPLFLLHWHPLSVPSIGIRRPSTTGPHPCYSSISTILSTADLLFTCSFWHATYVCSKDIYTTFTYYSNSHFTHSSYYECILNTSA